MTYIKNEVQTGKKTKIVIWNIYYDAKTEQTISEVTQIMDSESCHIGRLKTHDGNNQDIEETHLRDTGGEIITEEQYKALIAGKKVVYE